LFLLVVNFTPFGLTFIISNDTFKNIDKFLTYCAKYFSLQAFQYLEEDFKKLRKDFEDYKKLYPKEPVSEKKPLENDIPF
jgi:hypothetical protein